MYRCSSSEWSLSATVRDKGSKKAVDASSNETPCFSRLKAAFSESHSNVTDNFLVSA